VVGSRKAEAEARRDELMTSLRTDAKELKKAAAEYSKRRHAIFQVFHTYMYKLILYIHMCTHIIDCSKQRYVILQVVYTHLKVYYI